MADIAPGSIIMVGGYAGPGTPRHLLKALLNRGVGELTCISGPWFGGDPHLYGPASLVANGQVRKLITTDPVNATLAALEAKPPRGSSMEVELVAQGSLAERVRAGGAGLGAIFLPAFGGAMPEEGKEKLTVDGVEYVMETPIKAGFALIRAHKADSLGNLVYRLSQRNWNPLMAMAAEVTIVEVDHVVQPGGLDPELVITPGIFVDRIVEIGAQADEGQT